MGVEEPLTIESLVGLSQRAVSTKIDLNNLRIFSEQIQEQGCVRDIARFASVSLKDSHAGDWLTVVPSPGLGLRLQPAEFVAALRHRLGHPIYTSRSLDPWLGKWM